MTFLNSQLSSARAVKLWGIGILATLLVVAVLAAVATRHYSSPGYLEKKLTTAIARGNGVNKITIGSSSFNPFRGTFVATDLVFLPDSLLVEERIQAGSAPRSGYALTVSSFRVHGLRWRPLLRGHILADSITIDDARFGMNLDRTAGPSPPLTPATLPHVSFQSLAKPIRVDAIRVSNSRIGYSEKAADGSGYGTINFTELAGTIRNVTNDATLMTPTTPCTIDLRTRIAEAGTMRANFTYNLLAPELSLTYRGSVTRMNVEPLNELLVNLNGIRMTSGVVDTTWFDFKADGDIAEGRIQLVYSDLDFEILNKVTHERGIGKRIKSFMITSTTLNSANPSDDDDAATVATVQRERLPHTPLLKFMWQTLRQGILSTLGLA